MTVMIPTWVEGELVAVEKLEAHQRGLRHKAISVFVVCGDEILIQRRALGKYHTPGLWANTCCTHPAWGETALDCAMRRLDEELGITGLDLEFRDRVEYRADVGDGLIEHELVDIFLARIDSHVPMTPNPEEVMAVDWVSRDDLMRRVAEVPARYTPWLRIYLDQYSGTIFS